MSAVHNPADVVGERILMAVDAVEAACKQLDKGILPTRELTSRIRSECKMLADTVTADERNATAERIASQALSKANGLTLQGDKP